jgi:hypothetical protein
MMNLKTVMVNFRIQKYLLLTHKYAYVRVFLQLIPYLKRSKLSNIKTYKDVMLK